MRRLGCGALGNKDCRILYGLAYPDRGNEAWRYTRVNRIAEQQFSRYAPAQQPITEEMLQPHLVTTKGGVRLVFFNGRLLTDLSYQDNFSGH